MKKIFSILISCLMTVLLFTSCLNKNGNKENVNLSGELRISGAWALYPMTLVWAESFMKLHPNVKIEVHGGGAGLGINETMSGQNDLGMLSFELTKKNLDEGAYTIPVARDAVVVTCNPENPYIQSIKEEGMTKEQLEKVFIYGTFKNWQEIYPNASVKKSVPIHVCTRVDDCGAAFIFSKYLNNKTQNDLLGEKYDGDLGMLDGIGENKNALGYNNIAFIYDITTRTVIDGFTVVPIDMNADGKISLENENFFNNLDNIIKVIEDGNYTDAPTRNLYLVSKGKPTNPLAIAFIEYVLTEGQKNVHQNGYAELNKKIRQQAIEMIKNK